MKKFFALLLLFCLLSAFTVYTSSADLPFDVSAQSAVLYCVERQEFVYSKNADLVMPMASLTKIMTGIVVIENAEIDSVVTIDPAACGIEGSSIYLTPGERLTVKELLYALLLESANDAATALAIAVSGSVEEFTVLMNDKAEQLCLSSSHFTNPHGLDDEKHYSTAADLAILCDHAMKNETFAEIVTTKKTDIPYKENKTGRLLVNHNRLLSSYEGCIGVKTGFTKRSGRCLVSAAKRDGVTLIAVTLNAPNDWNDHKTLFDWGFSVYDEYVLTDSGEYTDIHVVSGTKDRLKAEIKQFSAILSADEYNCVQKKYNLKRFYFAPMTQNSVVGQIEYYVGEKLIGKSDILALESSEQVKFKRSFIEKFLDLFKR